MSLDQALAIVKAAGFRVSKPRAPRKLPRVGPTCVARFADGTVTRMSTNCTDESLDYDRGERISIAAWQTRQRAPIGKRLGELARVLDWDNQTISREQRTAAGLERESLLPQWIGQPLAAAPPIMALHFERDGRRLDRLAA